MAVNAVIVPQGAAVTRQTLYADAALTTSGSVGPWPVDFFSSAEIMVAALTTSGTLNVWLQKLMADGVTFADIAHITSVTTSNETKAVSFVNGGNTVYNPSNQVLASGSVLTINFGSFWRLAWQVSGVSATHSVGIYGDFFQ